MRLCFLMLAATADALSLKQQISGYAPTNAPFEELYSIASTSPNNLVEFNDTGYQNWVIRTGRTYDLFILYTAPESMCKICGEFRALLRRVSSEYYKKGLFRVQSRKREGRIFAFIDIAEYRSVSNLHQLASVPHLVHIEPKSWAGKKKADDGSYPLLNERRLDMEKGRHSLASADRVLAWINEETGEKVELSSSFTENLMTTIAMTLVFCLASVAALYLTMQARKSRWLIAAIALTINWLACSGLVYSQHHGAPLFGVDHKTGLIQFLHPGRRAQYLGEGLAIAGMSVLGGIALLIMTRLPKSALSKTSPESAKIYMKVFLALFLFCACGLRYLHLAKTGMQTELFFAPPEFVRGSYRNDRENTF